MIHQFPDLKNKIQREKKEKENKLYVQSILA